jgi:nickel transport protein
LLRITYLRYVIRMPRSSTILGLAALVLSAGTLCASGHALRHEVRDDAVAVRWHFDDGRPVAGGRVSVRAPGAGEDVYPGGTTDARGVFTFLPQTNGRWTVTVEDGVGHRADVYVDVDAGVLTPAATNRPGEHRLAGMVVGVSVLFGCFGLYGMWTGRRRNQVAGSEG